MWRAVFTSGETLEEFNKFGNEILFQNVMKQVDELKTLSIVLASKKTFTMRIKDGRFTIDMGGVEAHFYGLDINKYDISKFKNVRPIYFVRETVDFKINVGPVSQGTPPRVNFIALGFQANYNDKNIKRYLAIYPDGKYIICDE